MTPPAGSSHDGGILLIAVLVLVIACVKAVVDLGRKP